MKYERGFCKTVSNVLVRLHKEMFLKTMELNMDKAIIEGCEESHKSRIFNPVIVSQVSLTSSFALRNID